MILVKVLGFLSFLACPLLYPLLCPLLCSGMFFSNLSFMYYLFIFCHHGRVFWNFSLMSINVCKLNLSCWLLKVGLSSTVAPHCSDSNDTVVYKVWIAFVFPLKRWMKFFVLSVLQINFPEISNSFDKWEIGVTLKRVTWQGGFVVTFPPNKSDHSVDWITMGLWSILNWIWIGEKSALISIAASLLSIDVKSGSRKYC